jgi:hypothetical protein
MMWAASATMSGWRARRGGRVAPQKVLNGGRGDHGARPQRIHGDPDISPLLGQTEHAEAHAVLGKRVGQVGGEPPWLQAGRRSQHQDVRVGRTREGGQASLRAQEGAPGVDLVHQVEPLHVGIERAGEADGAGVVDEDVDAPEGLDGSSHGAQHLILESHVTRASEALPTGRLDLGHHLVNGSRQSGVRCLGLADRRDVRPITGGPERDGPADSATGARDEESLGCERGGHSEHDSGRADPATGRSGVMRAPEKPPSRQALRLGAGGGGGSAVRPSSGQAWRG